MPFAYYPLVCTEIEKMLALVQRVNPSPTAMLVEEVEAIKDAIRSGRAPGLKALHDRILRQFVRDLRLMRDAFAAGKIASIPVALEDYPGVDLFSQASIFHYRSPEDNQWARVHLITFIGLRPDANGNIVGRRW